MQIQEFDKFTEACSLMLIRKVKVNIWPSIHSLHQQTISFLVGTSSAKKEKKKPWRSDESDHHEKYCICYT